MLKDKHVQNPFVNIMTCFLSHFNFYGGDIGLMRSHSTSDYFQTDRS